MHRADDRRGWGTSATLATALVTAFLALAVGPAAAQQGGSAEDPDPPDGVTRSDSLLQQGDVQYRREVYRYPRRQRNPFLPVQAGVEEGPRFQNLVLSGVIYSPAIGSVAVLLDRTTGNRYRVREGERIGQATVLSIRRSDVVFSVSGPTRSRQETLQVEKQNEEVQR